MRARSLTALAQWLDCTMKVTTTNRAYVRGWFVLKSGRGAC